MLTGGCGQAPRGAGRERRAPLDAPVSGLGPSSLAMGLVYTKTILSRVRVSESESERKRERERNIFLYQEPPAPRRQLVMLVAADLH